MPVRLAFILWYLLFSIPQTDDVKVLGTSGGVQFVLVAPRVAKTDDDLRRTAHTVCAEARICGVRFWVTEAHAARRLPMTAEQARYLIAAYAINRNTGVDDFTCKPTADRSPPCSPVP
jgi:hypothetical protein